MSDDLQAASSTCNGAKNPRRFDGLQSWARLLRAAVAGTVAARRGGRIGRRIPGVDPGAQVNDDAVAGINKNLSVGHDDPANADVVGGALVAGKPAVPWSIFRQQENGTSQPHDQIFSRSFAAGAWLTRGGGTVGGRSSASPTFSGSLNLDRGAGRRGAGDRFRRSRTGRAVGHVV